MPPFPQYASIGVGAGVGLFIDLLLVQSTAASPSGRQTSLFIGVGPPKTPVRFVGAVRWR
jgi:hypothetical protein